MGKRAYSIDAPDQQRLKIARAKIEGILKEHDLGAVVVLHTPGMTEFFYDVTPSYSCAWIDEAAHQLRVKSKQEDYAGDKAAQLQDQAAHELYLRLERERYSRPAPLAALPATMPSPLAPAFESR